MIDINSNVMTTLQPTSLKNEAGERKLQIPSEKNNNPPDRGTETTKTSKRREAVDRPNKKNQFIKPSPVLLQEDQKEGPPLVSDRVRADTGYKMSMNIVKSVTSAQDQLFNVLQ